MLNQSPITGATASPAAATTPPPAAPAPTPPRGSMLDQLQSMSTGLAAQGPGGQTSLVVDDEVVQVADAATEFQGYFTIYNNVEVTKEAYQKALKARNAVAPQISKRTKAVRTAVKGALGSSNPALVHYGIAPTSLVGR